MTTGHVAGYSAGMENKPLRFRVPPEVHEHNRQLRAAGVDTAAEVARHLKRLVDDARYPMVRAWRADGFEVRVGNSYNQDGAWVLVPMNEHGLPWRSGSARRFVVALFFTDRRGLTSGGVTEVVNGDELVDYGQRLPDDRSYVGVREWVYSRIKELTA